MSRTVLAFPLIVAPVLMLVLTPSPLALAQQARPSVDQVGRALLADLTRAGQDMASEALAQWILASRDDALKAGVQSIPADIRARLKGHFPEDLLSRVRYRVGTGRDFTLQTNAFKGNTAAITLNEVILFRPDAKGETDARLWAHELTHVQQYTRWGVRGFARRYTLDHLGIEREAEAGEARYAAARAAR
jgi:hypothetical protein